MRSFTCALGLCLSLNLVPFTAQAETADVASDKDVLAEVRDQEDIVVSTKEENAEAPVVVRKMTAGNKPVAEMTSAWTIEPFSRVNGALSGECIMHANYDNGVELAFKGGENRLTALRITDIDMDDDIDVKGFIGLGAGNNSYGLQSKSHQGRVDASLLTVPAAGELIKSVPTFNVRIGTASHAFSSAGFHAGYDALMECQKQYTVTTLKVVDESRPIIVDANKNKMPSLPRVPVQEVSMGQDKAVEAEQPMAAIKSEMRKGQNNMPLAMALSMILPSGYSYQFDGTVNAMTPVSWDATGDWEAELKQAVLTQGYSAQIEGNTVKISSVMEPISVAQRQAVPIDQPKKNTNEWSAKKGESLINTLNGWAQQAGVKTDIRLDKDPVLKQDFQMNGSFEMAVNTLINRVSVGSVAKPSAVLTDGQGGVTSVAGYQGGSLKTTPTHADAGHKRWRALEGTDLRKVLMRWSDMEDIQLIWNTDKRFLVRDNVKTMANYTDAVTMILSQYEGQDVRPVAKLNTDPKTGKRALIIQIDG